MENDINSAKEYLKKVKSNIDVKLEKVLADEIERSKKIYPDNMVDIFDTYADVARRGGKRLRAAMAYSTYKMMGGQNDDLAYDLGVVIELIHAYILLIDDFIDQSPTRRGGPTAHEMIKEKLEMYESKDKEHIANSLAVTAASAGNHLALKTLAELDISPETYRKINQNLHEKLITTYYGEILDVHTALTQSISEKEITNMLKWKTSVYTFENPMHVGAILAGVEDKQLFETLSKFALPLGIAFQVKDDMLGIFGESTETGKSNLDDLKEGKITLLIQHCLENGSEEQKEQIKAILGNKYLDDSDLELVRVILTESGSLDYAQTLAENYINMAKTIVEKEFPKDTPEEEKKFLLGMTEYILTRDFCCCPGPIHFFYKTWHYCHYFIHSFLRYFYGLCLFYFK